MDTATLTILFEDPFWGGLYQRRRGGTYQVCKITFGPEPRDHQVYDLLLRHWHELRFTPPLPDRTAAERRINPKRQQRAIHREVAPGLPGTKAIGYYICADYTRKNKHELMPIPLQEVDMADNFKQNPGW